MSETEPYYFEVAKKLAREHASAASDLDPKTTELGIARDVVRSLVDRITFMAKLIHAQHCGLQPPGPWSDCQRSECVETTRLLASLGLDAVDTALYQAQPGSPGGGAGVFGKGSIELCKCGEPLGLGMSTCRGCWNKRR